MPYAFKVPQAMRLFEPVRPGATLLRRTGAMVWIGAVVSIAQVAIISYDHCAKLALQMEGEPLYFLLVEEVSDDVRGIAREWSEFYEDHIRMSGSERDSLQYRFVSITERLGPLLQQHIVPRQEGASREIFCSEGPGISIVG